MNLDDPLLERIDAAQRRYGNFASTHEALGVACEEWDELRAAIHRNDMDAVSHEALDLAAVLIRLANAVYLKQFVERSTK